MNKMTLSFAFMLLATLLFVSCEVEPVSMTGGKQIDAEALNNTSVSLRSMSTSKEAVRVIMSEGGGFITEGITVVTNHPLSMDQTIILEGRDDLIEQYSFKTGTAYSALPEAFYEFDSNGATILKAGDTYSEVCRLILYSTNKIGNRLKPGRYLLPVAMKSTTDDRSDNVIYYDVSVREKFTYEYDLYEGDDFFLVFYLNTSEYDPRLVTDYVMWKNNFSTGNAEWYNSIGNIVNLRKTTVGYDKDGGRALLNLSSDMKYVLSNYHTYVLPVQETGRKVCLTIEGGGTGLGFCNMSDTQIADFVSQIKLVFDNYPLDGISLWDRNSSYGKEGMPEANTTSYPKLIKALRDMLGEDKLLTLADYGDPTEYFWDADATGGISVGDYIDYAWSGYCDVNEPNLIIDPWHQESEYVSKKYPRKPIAGLSPEDYGCINAPWRPTLKTNDEMKVWEDSWNNVVEWVKTGHKQSNIIVCEDIRTALQDNYEFSWTEFFLYSAFVEGSILYGGNSVYMFDKGNLTNLSGSQGYGKWRKNW